MSDLERTEQASVAGLGSEVAGSTRFPSQPRLSTLAVAGLMLTPGPLVAWSAFSFLPTEASGWVVVRVIVALGALPPALAGIALVTDIRTGRRRGGLLCCMTFAVSGLYAVVGVIVVAQAVAIFGNEEIDYHLMPQVPGSVREYWERRRRAPGSVEDLVKAGLLDSEPVCGFDKARRTDPSIGGSSWVLAPLDDRFFGEFEQSVLLCVYCSVPHQFGPDWRICCGFQDSHIYAVPVNELRRWLDAQREATGWLGDSFPLSELVKVAATSGGHRREIARAVLEGRQRSSPGARTSGGAAEGSAP